MPSSCKSCVHFSFGYKTLLISERVTSCSQSHKQAVAHTTGIVRFKKMARSECVERVALTVCTSIACQIKSEPSPSCNCLHNRCTCRCWSLAFWYLKQPFSSARPLCFVRHAYVLVSIMKLSDKGLFWYYWCQYLAVTVCERPFSMKNGVACWWTLNGGRMRTAAKGIRHGSEW